MKVQTGLERLIESPPEWLKGKKIGLLCNPASIDSQFRHASQLIHRMFPEQLTALYSPQHGFHAEKQDNMIESDSFTDQTLNIPVYSLYGKTRIPTRQMIKPVDVLIIDLQDVGTRVYTFIHTVSYCMEAAKTFGTRVLVLDRPNPVTGCMIEGNCLSPDCRSFVGRFPIPMRHGMTIGELCLLFNHHFGIGCELDVIPMSGWKRHMYFEDSGLPWVAPSPNLPTPVSARVYPGQVLWEGTNISEGRGTTQPFETFGAPFIDTQTLLNNLKGTIPGAILRKTVFEPTSNKWQNCACNGFQIHITDPYLYHPYRTSLKLLHAIIAGFKNDFSWKQPPYEYEFERLPIDLILGGQHIRTRIERGDDIDDIEASWQPELDQFINTSKKFYLY
ncbi:MAG: DUF1343 domain-containing protein [Desulfobacterales bacterium]|nr:DUF1343 domain-containing protein [Desulfobacterales bacterium]MDD4070754.1 DUF1343 domain-containing protein [Desulfobacterales bacterium]MDD4391156.1 DUF1343 domain-containing protein [Desulfobacterales bacterium]